MSSEIGKVFSAAWQVAKNRFFPAYLILLIFSAFAGLFWWMIFELHSVLNLFSILTIVTIMLLLGPIPNLVVYHQLGSRLLGTRSTIRNSFITALRRYIPFFVANFILVLPSLILILLFSMASLLLLNSLFPMVNTFINQTPKLMNLMAFLSQIKVITGILTLVFLIWSTYLSIRLALCSAVAVMEPLSIIDIIRRTKILTKGKWWWTAMVLGIVLISSALINMVFNNIIPLFIKSYSADYVAKLLTFSTAYVVIVWPFMQLFLLSIKISLWHNLTIRSQTNTVTAQ